jgi:hypothetical protein
VQQLSSRSRLDDLVVTELGLLDEMTLGVAIETALVLLRDGLGDIALGHGSRSERDLHFGSDIDRRALHIGTAQESADVGVVHPLLQELLRIAAHIRGAQIRETLEPIELTIDVFLRGIHLGETRNRAHDRKGDLIGIALVADFFDLLVFHNEEKYRAITDHGNNKVQKSA